MDNGVCALQKSLAWHDSLLSGESLSSRLIQLLGTAIVLIALWFVWLRLRVELQNFSVELSLGLLLTLGSGIAIYAAANFLLAKSWLALLEVFGLKHFDKQQFRWIFVKSQLAKYIPGNVVQIAGRHVLAKGAGAGHAQLALSTIYEMLGLTIAACMVSLLALPQLLSFTNGWVSPELVWLLVFIITLAYIFAHRVIISLPFAIELTNSIPRENFLSAKIRILLNYCGFFLLGGSVLLALCVCFGNPLQSIDVAAVIASFAISWVIGFYTPGAPSGIGVREAALIALLGEGLGLGQAAVIALGFRIITVLGDCAFTGAGWWLAGRPKTAPS